MDQDVHEGGLLAGVEVLDFTRALSGPVATEILADLGATVIKVERPPDGDLQRADRGAQKSGTKMPSGFVAFNRNKKSIVLDLKCAEGQSAAQRLAARADVIVQNFRPGVVERRGLDYDTVRQANPSVVYCSISGFGHDGPHSQRAANDIIVQSVSGMISLTGNPGGPPVRGVGYPVDIATGIWGALGVMSALYHRQQTGAGQHVRLTMMDTALTSLTRAYGEYLAEGYIPKPLGSGNDMGAPNGIFPAADGWVSVAALTNGQWSRVCRVLGLEGGDAECFSTQALRRLHANEVNALVAEATELRTRDDLIAAMSAVGLSCGEVRTIDEVAHDPAFAKHFLTVPVDGVGDIPGVRSPLDFSRTPVIVPRGAPFLGQHQGEVLVELGVDPTLAMGEPVADEVRV